MFHDYKNSLRINDATTGALYFNSAALVNGSLVLGFREIRLFVSLSPDFHRGKLCEGSRTVMNL